MVHLHRSQRASAPWRLLISAAALSLLAISGGAAHAAGAERSLAGISIFSPGSEVTRKFGNPSHILVGGVAPGDATAGGASSGPGGPGASSGSPSPYPGSSSSSNPGAGLLPGFPGVPTNQSSVGGGSEFPGAPGGGLGTGGLGGAATPAAPVKQPVTLIYDRQNGGSLEFTVSPDKRVVQIRETGYSGAYGTTRGTRLGTSYAAVLARYGYPENTFISGPIINIDYKDTLHCGFQFLNQKLVAIIVAAPD